MPLQSNSASKIVHADQRYYLFVCLVCTLQGQALLFQSDQWFWIIIRYADMHSFHLGSDYAAVSVDSFVVSVQAQQDHS